MSENGPHGEKAVHTAGAHLNAVTYNAAGLDRNAIPRGLLTLVSDHQQRSLDNFTRQMRAMVQGAATRWTVPILAAIFRDLQDRQDRGEFVVVRRPPRRPRVQSPLRRLAV